MEEQNKILQEAIDIAAEQYINSLRSVLIDAQINYDETMQSLAKMKTAAIKATDYEKALWIRNMENYISAIKEMEKGHPLTDDLIDFKIEEKRKEISGLSCNLSDVVKKADGSITIHFNGCENLKINDNGKKLSK